MAIRAHGGTRHLRAALTATLCTALPLSAGGAQSTQLLSKEVVAARVDSMVRAYMAEKGPASVSVAISRGSETLVERAWGVADINTKRPAAAATVYKIGSVSKQFTAVLLLKRVERGKLALTDSIGRYLTTGLRPEWRSLRIEQLLNHTAGMPNDLTREGRPEEEVTTETMIAWAARDTMAFAPGTRMAYSNVGYLLLGALVEKLYGKPYGAALQEEIARPLGLRTLRWCTDPQKDTTVATGHDYQGPGKNQPSLYAHPSKSLGSGGLCASAPDLAAWNRALHGGRVLSPASYTAMITPRGVARGYGFGLQMTTTAWGAPIIYHVGGIIGFSAANAWFPSESLSVATLYNSAGKGLPTNFILEIARAISAPAPQKPPSDAAAPSAPPRPAELSARIDSVVRADILSRGFPSVSISITRGGKALLERAWGMANVATGQKADASTTYRIASVSKQFTAALVLKLVDRGKLALTDSIGRHLPGLRPEWNAIRIDQLLNHSSGLPRDFLDVKRVREQLSGDALIAMAARDTLVTKPGTAFAYSNTGYMLLGVLVEKLYGKPYGAVVRDEVAKPLGLTTLHQCDDVESGRAAVGYVRSSDGNVGPPNHQHVSQTLGAGGICATAGDIAKWNHALHNGRVLSAASYNAMTTPRGPSKTYGFGLVVRKSSWGSPAITHDGVENGFTIHNGWYSADSLSVTVLYNARPYFDEVLMPDFIGFVALGGSPQPVPPVRAIELPVSATQGDGRPKFVGAYELTIGSVFIVTFEDGNLHVTPPGGGKPQQLFLKSGTSYALGSPEGKTTLTFNVDASGVTGFTVRQNGVDRELRKVK